MAEHFKNELRRSQVACLPPEWPLTCTAVDTLDEQVKIAQLGC